MTLIKSMSLLSSLLYLITIGYGSVLGFSFDKTVHDFGVISQNRKVETVFVISNNSLATLIITAVDRQCGCTTPIFKKKPILGKQKDSIFVGYDAAKIGAFTKKVTVSTNLGNQDLFLRGKVEE